MPPPLLRSLHLSVDGPDGSRPTVATVKGGYDYWHYVCDGFNDRGWGCAYRTAQTMFSHHLREGGTCDVVGGGMSIPSVRKMQQILVDAGDKDKGFVGSADWIGSCEIALLFDVLYGVPCRLLSINNGSEVAATWSDALWDHFTREGTPVMCGGAVGGSIGILGIDLTDRNNVMLLFIDPHYSGAVGDVAAVAQAPWCFWGECSRHFAAGAFYNACLPLPSRAPPPADTAADAADAAAAAAALAAAADGGAVGIEVVGSSIRIEVVDSGSEAAAANFGIEVVASGSANEFGIE